MEVWTLWHGTYWLSGAIKAVTAMASVPTAILLVQLVPKALALPRPEAMKLEIAERKRTEQALHQAKNELELKVLERTAELRKVNEDLLAEIVHREQAEEALRGAQAELAHVIRVTTVGEMTASIAHEVNQPLSAVVINAGTCLRWLARDPPNLDEAREAARRTVRDGKRAGDVIARIRALATKTVTAKERTNLNEAIQEIVALVRSEVRKNNVTLRTELEDDLSPVLGDRVQLQQVVLNLVMNGVQAMSTVGERPRELVIRTQKDEADQVRVAIQDSGISLDPQSMDRIFDAFYTTKHEGMGLGLSISRSIVRNHGGGYGRRRMTAQAQLFSLPFPSTSRSPCAEARRNHFGRGRRPGCPRGFEKFNSVSRVEGQDLYVCTRVFGSAPGRYSKLLGVGRPVSCRATYTKV